MGTSLDARGLSCPEPALRTRAALVKTAHGDVTVLVDSPTQVENCARAGERLGWQVAWVEQAGVFTLTFRKQQAP
jgi:TusA-related sulfurtransferase